MVKKSMKSLKKKGGCWSGGCAGGKRRTVKGGAYGVGAPIAAGALTYDAAYTGPVNAAGNAVPDPTDPAGGYTGVGGRRRKTSKKSRSRKGRKGKKTRTMRGGASQISAMKAGYGFNGSGAGGLADAVPAPTSGGNAF